VSLRRRRSVPIAVATIALCLAAAGAIAGAADKHRPTRFSAWDEQWLMASIQGDRFEIAGGRLAQTKATTAEVRALGGRLVKDHSKSLSDAMRLARRLDIEVPALPSPSQRWELKTIDAFAGVDFDRRYADLEVLDHQQDIQESRDEIQKGSNHAVRHAAHSDLPKLVAHLKLSRDALRAAGG
jgi:putative membrane protein